MYLYFKIWLYLTKTNWLPCLFFKNMVACSQGSPGTRYIALSSWSSCLHFSQIGSIDTMLGSTWVLHLPFPEFQTWILIMLPSLHESLRQRAMYFLILFSLLYMCLSVLACVCVGTCRGQRYQNSPELELQVVCKLPDVGARYWSWVLCRVHVVTTEPSL